MPEEISFYQVGKPYGWLSNLHPCVIEFEHWDPAIAPRTAYYPTAEHAYQVGKPRSVAIRNWIFDAPHPSLVARAGHALYRYEVVPDWSKIKVDRMRRILRVKFARAAFGQSLLKTGAARLVEKGTVSNAVNRYWGEVNGKGKNMLGVLLMEIRAELRATGQVPEQDNAS